MYQHVPGEELEHEDKERYRPGGFHPIVPGDKLGYRGRYKVTDKLGWGYGSTVWLCRDSGTDAWRAVKVLQAKDSSEENNELKIFKLLEHVGQEELERSHIGLPESYFWQDGPNGKHLCFVSKLVAAMSLLPPSGYGLHSPTLLTDLCYQLAVAVKFLHDKGISHGDIRMQNIGMRLDDAVDRLSSRELQHHIGEPMRYSSVERLSGRPAYPHAPDNMYERSSLSRLESKYRTGRLVLIDFGLSYETAQFPHEQISYRSNAAPELLFKRSPRGPATDLWALACVFIELRTPPYSLVSEFDTWVHVLQTMEWRFGPLPEVFRNDVLAKLDTFDEYSVDEKRETPWKPGDPLAIPISLETYNESKDDWSNQKSIQWLLDQVQQTHRYHLTEQSMVPDEYAFYDGTSDAYSSDEDGSSARSDFRVGKDSTKRHSFKDSPSPLGDETTPSKSITTGGDTNQVADKPNNDLSVSEQGLRPDVQRFIGRGQLYKRGNFPDSSNPCICDWDRERRRRIGVNESCPAEQHWDGDPGQIVVWRMGENEQRVFGDLLSGIFKYDPEERLSTEQVLNHRWFKQRRDAHMAG
ncbi:hypothetical protein PG990_007700 [Apiospora arundinis]